MAVPVRKSVHAIDIVLAIEVLAYMIAHDLIPFVRLMGFLSA
jgi:hypothetical protein